MRPALLAILAASLHAATVRGSVVEHQSGKPLSRVLVKLLPLPGVAAQPVTTHTNSYGAFEFANVPAGSYILTASRHNFVTVQYGQKQWNSAGQPLVLDAEAAPFLTLRMPHFGAITGRVVDENDVGIPHRLVAAYKNTRPPQLAAHAIADEKGDFRIYGLDPGSYVVRSAPAEDEAIAYLPTFSKDTTTIESARPVDVAYDQDTGGIEIRPIPGKLLKVYGAVDVSLPEMVNVTFATDMGRQTVQTASGFRFNSVPPGSYELYAEAPGDGTNRCQAVGGWEEVDLHRDHPLGLSATCTSLGMLAVTGVHGEHVDTSGFHLLVRRVDLAGSGEIHELDLEDRRPVLLPGHWQVMLQTPPNFYVASFSGNTGTKLRPGDWNDVLIRYGAYLRFSVSASPGGVHGTVNGESHDPVAGVPVFLERYDSATNTRIGELRSTLTDLRGQYHFRGLAPGDYRLLATFEYQSPDPPAMDMAQPQSISVQEGGDVQQDLDLFVLR